MVELRIEELLKEKGISKSKFAEMMQIQKQNVYQLLETNNLRRLEQIAEVLQVKLTDLWTDPAEQTDNIFGIIEYNGTTYTIKSRTDIEHLLSLMPTSR